MRSRKYQSFYIDIESSSLAVALRILRGLKTTNLIENDGAYHQALMYTRLYLETTWSEEEVEDWLYNTNYGIEYVGVCEAPAR